MLYYHFLSLFLSYVGAREWNKNIYNQKTVCTNVTPKRRNGDHLTHAPLLRMSNKYMDTMMAQWLKHLHWYHSGRGFESRCSLKFSRLEFRVCLNWVKNCEDLYYHKRKKILDNTEECSSRSARLRKAPDTSCTTRDAQDIISNTGQFFWNCWVLF